MRMQTVEITGPRRAGAAEATYRRKERFEARIVPVGDEANQS